MRHPVPTSGAPARPRPRVVLATDLDGTMAHGDPDARVRLARWLRHEAGGALVYVTGRSPDAVAELAARAELPEPDVLIADVGTSVLEGFGPARVTPIEREMDEVWPGAAPVRERLAALSGSLSPQDVDAPRRISWWIEPVRRMRRRDGDPFAAASARDPSLGEEAAKLAAEVGDAAREALADLDVDVLVSANVFLDVLPRGVDKGSTLRRVLAWMGAGDDACVVAGDSMNDLALFETGLRGIAVGNCEPMLRQRVGGMGWVYVASGEGVEGVIEGLGHHGVYRPDGAGEASHGE